MPISKSGKSYFTDEQYQVARYECNALEYVKAAGHELVQKGKQWSLKEHDSFVFSRNGEMWFWNSRDMKGGAIEFLTQYEHKSYVEAVLTLAGERGLTLSQAARTPAALAPGDTQNPEFALPERSENHRRVYAYLTATRGIAPTLVSQLMKERKLYESAEHHNAVFVFENNDGEPTGAFLRGTNTQMDRQYKGMATGSDRSGGYFMMGGGKKATVACVFEACIDALSYATLQLRAGNSDLSQRYYLASGGTGHTNILSFAQAHPEVKHYILCQDNDQPGNTQADSLGEKLRGMGLSISRSRPKTAGADYGDELLAELKAGQEMGAESDFGLE